MKQYTKFGKNIALFISGENKKAYVSASVGFGSDHVSALIEITPSDIDFLTTLLQEYKEFLADPTQVLE